LTLITETYEEEPPDQADLQTWANEYNETFPVLSDGNEEIDRYSIRGDVSLPSHTLIGPGAVVLIADGDITEEDIVNALP